MNSVQKLLNSTHIADQVGTAPRVVIRAAIRGRIRPDFTAGRVLLFRPERLEEIRQILKP